MNKVEENSPALIGTVLDIERFSVHDGKGIRTVVFLKGCPLKCEWCANPESQQLRAQVGFFKEKCVACMKCADICPNGSLFREQGRLDFKNCTGCMKCVDVCYNEARIQYGKRMSAAEVVEIVKRDKVFYDNSGGGVTLSGGEMSMQHNFALEILKGCRKAGIHTAVETCGYSPWEPFSKILEYVDLLLYDIKNMDSKLHKEKTGVFNALILENASKAAPLVEEMIIRYPVIPEFNDSLENALALARYIKAKLPGVTRVDLLPYHSMGESKCERIGKLYPFKSGAEINSENVQRIYELLSSQGLDVSIGG